MPPPERTTLRGNHSIALPLAQQPALVGRAAELAALQSAREASPGPRTVMVVHGEAGIGKTRLVAEFARAAHDRGGTILWGSCYEDSARPYGPWGDLIDRYLANLEPQQIAELLWTDATVLVSVAPSIASAIPELPPAPALASSDAQLRLFDTVARFIGRLEDPMIVLDDLQWADLAALEVLVHVARVLPHVFMVVIFRGAKLRLSDPIVVRLGSVARFRPVRYLALQGLSRDGAAKLLQSTADEPLEEQLVEAVYEETRGNPLFLSELARHIRRGGRRAEGWQLPETIRGAVALRLSSLSPQTRQVLELAAVFTSGFAFEELRLVGDYDESTLLDLLEEALDAELLEPVNADRYDYAHSLVRQTLYERVNPSRRARMHRRVAEALVELYPDPSPALAAEIARQYHASAALAGAERGIPYALAAAEHARSLHAPPDAVELLRSALALVPHDDELLRADVMARLSLVLAEAGTPTDAAATLSSAVTALERAGADPHRIAELTCDVATAMWSATFYPWTVVPQISRALELLGDEHSLLWARLKLLDRFAEPIRSGPIRILRYVAPDAQARQIVRSQGAEAHIASTIEVTGPYEPGELESLIAQVARWQDDQARCTALFWLVARVTLSDPAPIEESERLCRRLETLADEIGALAHRTGAAAYRSALYGREGSFSAAAQQLASAHGLMQRLPERQAFLPLVLALETLIAQHCDPEWWRAGDQLLEVARAAGGAPYASPLCGALACYALAHEQRTEQAHSLLTQLLPALDAASPWDHMVAPAIAYAAAAIWELRDEELAGRLAPVANAVLARGVADWYMTSNDLTVARLASLVGDLGEALAAFDRARQRMERQQQRPLIAIVDYDEAQARVLRGAAGAPELLRSAQAKFEDLGMTVWSERAERARGAGRRLAGGLTRREAEVLRLLAGGMTNRQIADALVLSVHTVERHINNIYGKIGAHNRAEAAAYAIRHEI